MVIDIGPALLKAKETVNEGQGVRVRGGCGASVRLANPRSAGENHLLYNYGIFQQTMFQNQMVFMGCHLFYGNAILFRVHKGHPPDGW